MTVPTHAVGRSGGSRRRPARAVSFVGSALVAVVAAGSALLGFGSRSPAGADPLSSCTTTTGVIVVVDFTAFHDGNSWDGTLQRGCAASATSGEQAMVAAGFTPAGDQHDGPAFVCRIDDDPSPALDPCTDTPPVDASWSYWHGDVQTNTWTYSTTGFTSYCPPPGSVEAWVFAGSPDAGPGGRPSQSPSAFAANTPGPPSADPCTGTTGGGASPPASSSPGAGAASAGAGSPGAPSPAGPTSPGAPAASSTTTTTAAAGPHPSTTHSAATGENGSTATPATTGRTPSASRSANAPRIVDVSPASVVRQKTDGSPWASIVGLAVVLVVILAGTVAGLRVRRRREEG